MFEKSRFCHISPTMFPHSSFQRAGANPGPHTVSLDLREVWRKSIEVFEDGRSAPRTVALFAEDQTVPIDDEQVVQVRLKDLEVRNARQ